MKKILLKSGLVILTVLFINACKKDLPKQQLEGSETVEQDVKAYDSIKANAYGADDYGMKKYVIAFLKSGPNKSADSIERINLQRAHLDNIKRLASEGKLVLAGPFFGNDDLRGIYVFDAQSIEEAESLTKTDPAIKAGILVMELREWYGSAALMEINQIHNNLAKKDI